MNISVYFTLPFCVGISFPKNYSIICLNSINNVAMHVANYAFAISFKIYKVYRVRKIVLIYPLNRWTDLTKCKGGKRGPPIFLVVFLKNVGPTSASFSIVYWLVARNIRMCLNCIRLIAPETLTIALGLLDDYLDFHYIHQEFRKLWFLYFILDRSIFKSSRMLVPVVCLQVAWLNQADTL